MSLCSRSTNVDSVVVPPPVWVWDIPNPKLLFMKLLWQMHKCWLCASVISSTDMKNSDPGWLIMKQFLHRWPNVDYMIVSVADHQLPHIQKTHIHDESPKTRMTLKKNLHQHPQQSSMGARNCYIHGGTELLHPWGHGIVTKPGYGQSYWWPDINMLSNWETARTFGKKW